jgi:RND superfamily putative drug exporter
MPALARWCFHHRKLVLALWLLALVVSFGAAKAAGTAYSIRFNLPNTDSTRAVTILQHGFPAASGEADQIVLEATKGTLRTPAVAREAEVMLSKVSNLPHVVSVISPFQPSGGGAGTSRLVYGPRQTSPTGTIAFATVNWDQQGQDLSKPTVTRLIDTATAARSPDLRVELGGQAIENAEKQKQSDSTALGVIFALIVLGILFGAVLAAVIPIVTALIAIGIGFALTGLMSHVIAVAQFVPILGVLIGLGVGVDYALFIITRHRNGLRAGRSIEDAAVNAANTAGRAVFFAGVTVCIALLGQFALGITFLYGLAIAGAVTVALTMFAALTLMPALLGFFGLRVLGRSETRRLEAEGPVSEQVVSGFWYRWARSVEKRPLIRAAAALLVVVVIALPIFTLRLGLADAGSDPSSTTSRQAYDLLAKGFGPGFNGPLELVSTIDGATQLAAFTKVVDASSRQKGVVRATPVRESPTGKAAVAILYPSTAPQAGETSSLLHELRHHVIPAAEAGTGLHVLVGGATAGQDDFAAVLSSKLVVFIAVVVVVAFLLLMLVFRSLLIPAVASIMNLLSVGAALGVMNAVFEWGWGLSLIGVSRTGPVEVFIPVIMFSVLFGLSMDYEVFLVSRMMEEWTITHDNRESVTKGQTETGRVITAAAVIMILVFLSFLLGGSIIIEQFGIGLAGAIVIDAFIVRTVLVPSLMHLFGPANWWLPGWLDRLLPHVNVDAPDAPPPSIPQPAPVS